MTIAIVSLERALRQVTVHKTLWLLIVVLALSVMAKADPPLITLSDKPETYSPVSRYAQAGLGKLRLSKSSAAFAKLRGHMVLQYAGRIPCKADEPYGCGEIYAVTNAAAFARANRKNKTFCAPRWLGIAPSPSPQGGYEALEIAVSQFDIADYRDYAPDKTGLCAGDTYSQD